MKKFIEYFLIEMILNSIKVNTFTTIINFN